MDITIDEWLYYFLADEEKYLIADKILTKIYSKCDRIVYTRGSKMHEKINMLSKLQLPKQRNVIKKFSLQFSWNYEKVLLLEQSDLSEVPPELISSLPHKEKDKDIYLIQTCLTTDDKIIITTDKKLKDAIGQKYDIRVKLVEEFINEYLKEN